MSSFRLRLTAVAALTLVAVVLLWSCANGDDTGTGEPGATSPDTVEPDDDPDDDADTGDEPPAFVPVTGPTGDDGTPEPPPIHAVFSVVVRGATSWEPYAGPELTSLDEAAARAVAARLRQLEQTLDTLDIPASIELAYGPAAALCTLDPDLFEDLEASGHRLGIHARTRGEAFRAHRALAECGRAPTTISGLVSMADPAGPAPPTPQTLVDAFAVVSVLDLHQVVGRLSPLCTDLALAAPTHGYGTGAFTAPWRSGWTEDRPCSDLPRGRVVAIDQSPLDPSEGADRIGPGSLSTLGARVDQVLGYALDHRYVEVVDLPAPGFITWGVTVRLDDLIAAPPEPGDDSDDSDDAAGGDTADDGTGDSGDDTDPDTALVDPRTAPLSEETLAALVELATERWGAAVERGRLRWMLPDDVAAIFRPLVSSSPAS